MTRDEVELTCKNVRELGQLVWEADKLQANDAEQRAMIDEQVEENRGLRADVLLMQKANAEQREEIERLTKEKDKWAELARSFTQSQHQCLRDAELLKKEITRLRLALDHANKRPNIMMPPIGYGEGRSSFGVFELCNPQMCRDPKHAHLINDDPCPKEPT